MREEAFRIFGFIAFGLVIVLGFLASIQLLSTSPLWGDSGAAWVQALGSIAAIIGAYAIGERQSRAALLVATQMQDREVERKRDAILAICQAANTRANLVQDIFCLDHDTALRRHTEYDASILKSIIVALGAIPLHEMANTFTVVGILDMRDQLVFLIDSVQRLFDDWTARADDTAEVTESRRSVLRSNVDIHVGKIFDAYNEVALSMKSNYVA